MEGTVLKSFKVYNNDLLPFRILERASFFYRVGAVLPSKSQWERTNKLVLTVANQYTVEDTEANIKP